ncbi:MAG: bifunctional 23S rRNA (guanine(2069)-N(7))-methyltransferase RlmK/23S rRNA (guanine(2445)-N(2))-methyltransferase RlmL, partial [Planctomycetota bacterium]
MELIATTAFGLEKLVVHELRALGYEPRVARPGRVHFAGDAAAVARANLWLRAAERVLVRVAEFEATDFGVLFDGTTAAAWSGLLPADGEFPVRGRSHNSQLSSVPACQKIVKKAVVESLRRGHGVTELPESGPLYTVEVAMLDDRAELTVDTTGQGLHKRGYRPVVAAAPLRETLAAALVRLSFWRNGRPLLDPFCGSGTIAIEAALIGRNLAPGIDRDFAAEEWPTIGRGVWQAARDEAWDLALPKLDERVVATDADADVLRLARKNAAAAGVADDIHFQQRAFGDTLSKREHGCLITNPPYGERLGEAEEIAALYATFPDVLRRLKTWSHAILVAGRDFERRVGQTADKRRKLYNGRIECTLYQFHGPKPVTNTPSDEPKPRPPAAPAFGGLRPEATRQAEEFANRLRKNARHLRRWPTKQGVTCFRLYDRDIPEVPLAVDRYETVKVDAERDGPSRLCLHIAEYERPHDRTPAEHADWLDHMVRTAAKALDVSPDETFVKRRQRQRGADQYGKFGDRGQWRTVAEGGLRFRVNLSDYLDTGLFLDHRVTRGMVREAAAGKRVLNLFAYTGSFSVYAAAGGAASTTTVDLSPTYLDWAKENLRLNGFGAPEHQCVQADSRDYIAALPREPLFDLAVVDPPTFSNSKRSERRQEIGDWDVQQHAAELLNEVAARLYGGGVIYFSTNSRRFKLRETELDGLTAREISRQTVPEDFRNKRIHRCWRMVKPGPGGGG